MILRYGRDGDVVNMVVHLPLGHAQSNFGCSSTGLVPDLPVRTTQETTSGLGIWPQPDRSSSLEVQDWTTWLVRKSPPEMTRDPTAPLATAVGQFEIASEHAETAMGGGEDGRSPTEGWKGGNVGVVEGCQWNGNRGLLVGKIYLLGTPRQYKVGTYWGTCFTLGTWNRRRDKWSTAV
ncbi:uncharacterized protein LY79DRAFT_659654 [Colletotrichum navitas]|uniref:Uncharacterized protein n=1 Tax=Colletotrichum navitas TaxID=681940 RepID=A0AAD8PXX6_9PEZI|nr:uncharacterized protein LY79DRAFT_659654 [Colletotrichum navitas]KAK1590135.1 hypothetical protein LY79DRAFT_659654 [Colletotrichum navitas]